VVEVEYREQVEDIIQMCENADGKLNLVANELVSLPKPLDEMIQALVLKLVECGRLVLHAPNDAHHDVVQLLIEAANSTQLVEPKGEITPQIALSNSMQTKLDAAFHNVKETRNGLAITEDDREMISEQMELAKMELNSRNEALIRVKADFANISVFQTNSSNHVFNIPMTGLPTCNDMKTIDAITSFISTLDPQCGPHAQELGLTDEIGILLKNGSASVAQLQCHENAAVWANHRFPVHPSAGITWEDISASVDGAMIPPDVVTRLKRHWDSL